MHMDIVLSEITAGQYKHIQQRRRVVLFMGVRARGLGVCSPPDSGKTIIFRANANFFGQNPAAKNEKYLHFLYLLNEKTEFNPPSEIKCPKSGIFTNIYWVG